MRNFSPSVLVIASMCLSCSAYGSQATVEEKQTADDIQEMPAAGVGASEKPNMSLQMDVKAAAAATSPRTQETAQKSNLPSPALQTTSTDATAQSSPKTSASTTGSVRQSPTQPANTENPSINPAGAGQVPPKQPPKADTVSKTEKKKSAIAAKFDPFTGKITKNKVRVRLQPAFDGAVLREVSLNDLVVVTGESDDFYAIMPPPDAKAYVYRTFILDNVVEGNRVNARLKPDLEAPVVAQLNSGDRVEGVIHQANNKWMEIKLPASARFYIAKEYIAKAGDAGLKARLEKKQEEALQLLTATAGAAKTEMDKPFDQINLDGIKSRYDHLMKNYPEFPEAAAKAKEAMAALSEAYTAKKLAHLENQSRTSSTTLETNKKLAAELQAQKSKVNELKEEIEKNRQQGSVPYASDPSSNLNKPDQLPVNMSAWIPAEESLIAAWSRQSGKHNAKEFYEEQKKDAFTLKGIIDPYNRTVKNKPGDYMLLNSSSKLPVAFLYSTSVNLQQYVGHDVTLLVVPRNNNHFAFPAYFVLQLE